MSKVIIEIPLATGDIYEVRSELLSRTMFIYINKCNMEDNKDPEKNAQALGEIAKNAKAEWRLKDADEWQNDKWNDLPPVVTTSWLNKLVLLSGVPIEAQVRSEKN